MMHKLWRPNRPFPRRRREFFRMAGRITGPAVAEYRHKFPSCEPKFRDILLGKGKGTNRNFGSQFYVRKLVWTGQGDRIVHFIAGPQPMGRNPRSRVYPSVDPIINNRDQLDDWKDNNPWYGTSNCDSGEIMDVDVNDHVMIEPQGQPGGINLGYAVSARRCGFGTFLSYLCFIDNDHMPGGLMRGGHSLAHDPRWKNPQMKEIMNLGFNNQQCSRIIYVNYTPDDAGTQGGNKAIIYGAAAAGYKLMVTYRTTPCRGAGCCDSELFDRRANTFQVHHLVDDFNKIDTPSRRLGAKANWLAQRNFQRHYGRHWYFCRV